MILPNMLLPSFFVALVPAHPKRAPLTPGDVVVAGGVARAMVG